MSDYADLIGRRITEIILVDVAPRYGKPFKRFAGVLLDDGRKLVADGGEDAQGGYGYLEVEPA